jgi:hypothetical protein
MKNKITILLIWTLYYKKYSKKIRSKEMSLKDPKHLQALKRINSLPNYLFKKAKEVIEREVRLLLLKEQ